MAGCVYWRYNITDETYRCVVSCAPGEVAEPSDSLVGFECKKSCSYARPFVEINNTCVSACSSRIIRGNNTCLESLETCDYYRVKNGLKQCVDECPVDAFIQNKQCVIKCEQSFYPTKIGYRNYCVSKCIPRFTDVDGTCSDECSTHIFFSEPHSAYKVCYNNTTVCNVYTRSNVATEMETDACSDVCMKGWVVDGKECVPECAIETNFIDETQHCQISCSTQMYNISDRHCISDVAKC